MRLIKRINQLIAADAHAVLDSIEDPHALLKQAMRDMASVIEEDESAIKQTQLNLEQLNLQAELFQKQQVKFNQDLDLCFESDNQELARSTVKKKLYLAQQLELFHAQYQKSFLKPRYTILRLLGEK